MSTRTIILEAAIVTALPSLSSIAVSTIFSIVIMFYTGSTGLSPSLSGEQIFFMTARAIISLISSLSLFTALFA